MKKKIFIFFLILILIFLLSLFFLSKTDYKNIFSTETRFNIKKYIFPYKYISQLEKTLLKNRINATANEVYFALDNEIKFKKNLRNFQAKKKYNNKVNDNIIIEYFRISEGFHSGINNAIPGSGFIDFFNDELFVLSSKGILGYSSINLENFNFKQIDNNIYDFIAFKQFSKGNWFSLKDLLIYKNIIFISYTEEISENCWNTSIIHSNLNYKFLKFKKLFTNSNCIHAVNNIDKEFNAHQSGGRIVGYDNEHIFFTLGEYRSRFLAQELDNFNGKVVKINFNNSDVEIISLGHRNPQGLFLDREKNFLLETEHGPKGGDEVNLIYLDEDKILNFGWPISSEGIHYKRYNRDNIDKYKKYPLYKSHTDHGFIEPLKSFNPSIGISEIVKINENKYVLGSLNDRSLYFFELSEKNEFQNMERIEVSERIRDLKYYKNKLYLFLEDTPSIGIISFE